VLDRQGNFYTRNLRGADQKVTYVLKGGGEEVLEPALHVPGIPLRGSERVVAASAGRPDRHRDPLGPDAHGPVRDVGPAPEPAAAQHRLGQKGNFVGVPTDCPQRDERLGWTGDAQVFAPHRGLQHGCGRFFTTWLADLAADQKPNGSVPHVIPDVLTHGRETGGGATGWATPPSSSPWTMYLTYGDTRLLERSTRA